jgi:hypothetical protein
MFERYTEKARRVIFFARYDASQYGSYYIDTEHLLLGLMRENFPLLSNMMGSGISAHAIQQEIEKQIQRGERFSTAAEVPLSVESKRVLNFAGGSGKIGTTACWHRAFAACTVAPGRRACRTDPAATCCASGRNSAEAGGQC